MLVGDFNARILRADGLNQENFGRHFLKSEKETHEINKDVWDNRERFVDFVHENDLIVKNTMYSKRNKNRCTLKKQEHWAQRRKTLEHDELWADRSYPD